MALVLGTNCGFVTTAPTSDPDGTNSTIDGYAKATRDTSNSTAVKITEIGWWLDGVDNGENYEVGLYDTTGSGGSPGNIIHVSRINTFSGDESDEWITISVDWAISTDTTYWIALQLDDGTLTRINFSSAGGSGTSLLSSQTTLEDPFGGSMGNVDAMYAIYALVVEEVAGITRKIKISGTFQDKPIKTKVGGTFVDKPIKIKVGGTFQDA